MTKVVKKKARRLRRSIRKTLGTLFLISALVVAAIPVDYLQAEGEDYSIDTYAEEEDWGTLAGKRPEAADIPQVSPENEIYTTGDGRYQFACVSPDGASSEQVAVILGYRSGVLGGGTLTIPNTIDYVYLQMFNNEGTGQGYVAVGKRGNFLYYKEEITKEEEHIKEDGTVEIVQVHVRDEYYPCTYNSESKWRDLPADQFYYYPDGVTGTDDPPVQTLNTEFQRIKDIEVRYIGNQYLTTGDGGEGTWKVAGTVDYANRANGIFADEGNITTLQVGRNIMGIGDYAFYGCTNLEGIELNDGLNTIGIGAFAECINIVNVNLPYNAKITVIGDYAFYDCRRLESFLVPTNVRKIWDSVFENCTGLKHVDLTGEGREVALNEVGRNLFRGCESLESITFPVSFRQTIDVSIFDGCRSLQYIEAADTSDTIDFVGDFDRFKQTVPSTFYFKGLKNSRVHQTATANRLPYNFYDEGLGQYVFELTITDDYNRNAVLWSDEEGTVVYCGMDPGMNTVELPSIIGPTPIIAVGEGTFRDNCQLETITIPPSIQVIKDNAFRGSHNLENVIFTDPADLTTIGSGAFQTQQISGSHGGQCDGSQPGWEPEKQPVLNFVGPISNDCVPFAYAMDPSQNINVGEQDLTYINYYSGWPTNLKVRYNPVTDKNTLVDYPTVQELERGKYNVSDYAYMTPAYAAAAVSAASKYVGGQGGMTEDEDNIISATLNIVLPDGIEAIGTVGGKGLFETKEYENEYSIYPNIRKTITAEGIEQVAANAFKGCKYLTGITFSDKTTTIGEHAFENCELLQNVSIPTTVSSMGLSPFRGCNSLSEVNFNGSSYFTCENSIIYEAGETGPRTKLVEYLGGKKPTNALSSDFTGVQEMYPEAFMGTNVQSVDMTGADIAVIPVSAFQGTESLYSVILPEGCRRVERDAFSDSGIAMLRIPSERTTIDSETFEHRNTTNLPDLEALTFVCVEDSLAEDYALNKNIHVTYIVPTYTVSFYDEEYNVVATQYVEEGSPFESPTDLEELPEIKGYTRLTWTPPSGTIVTGDLNVYAKYVNMDPSEYQKTVNFIAFDKETVISTQTVTPGESAVPPIAPEEDGYRFTGWWPEVMEITDETENPYNIYAQYEKVDSLDNTHTVTFLDYDNTFLYTQSVEHGKDAAAPRTPSREGYTFKEWRPYPVNVTEDMTVVAQYTQNATPRPGTSTSPSPSSSPSTSPSGSPGTSASPTPPAGGNTGSSNNVKTYKLTVRNGSGSGDYAAGSQIIVSADIPGANMEFAGWTVSPASTSVSDKSLTAMAITMPANDVAVIANYKSRTTGTGNTTSTNVNRPGGTTGTVNRDGGNTVIIDKNGLSNTRVVSANVHGSSDNFTIRVKEDSSATEAVLRALQAEYGSLENVKYFPMDISLYDSTGNTEITDTTGLSVSITLPLPDSLITYAGNNKVAGVVNDRLDKLTPKFTTIDGVSCITFTAEHFSPYVIYVDVTQLSDGTISDNTPTTGDGIHPKWFLSIGLACLSFVMFMMKDNGKTSRKKRKVAVRA